ncbi:MAG: hypothetical protein IKJ36_01260 [Clostridia bacterium]|nr:hypothetical protein [Clostridia bacterium]
MKANINFYSEKDNEIKRFLEHYYSKNLPDFNYNLHYQEYFDNPIDMINIMSCFIDNKDNYEINLWISLDEDVFICVTESNLNNIVKYLYERYPY